jgi:ribonuclease HI
VEGIEIHTDGGCHGNPGPGAWAFVVGPPVGVERSGSHLSTTNNRMELEAVIEALRFVIDGEFSDSTVRIVTDSQYVRNGITSWITSWLKNGWKTAARKPVKNQDLWIRLHELDSIVQPKWEWVRGHAGIEQNERCDLLVQQQIALLENN